MGKPDRYHHGDLRETLMAAALVAIARDGATTVSLRQLAREAGVSHGAPAHHFGDRAGLFTALAVRGLDLFCAALSEAAEKAAAAGQPRLPASGKAYVLFAAANPALFEVMFRPDLLDRDDADLRAALGRAGALLRGFVAESRAVRADPGSDVGLEALRAWTHAHGLATLWLAGNLPPAMAPDGLEALVDRLFGTGGAGVC